MLIQLLIEWNEKHSKENEGKKGKFQSIQHSYTHT